MAPRAIMAELFGRIDGVVRGKGGSMHLFDRNVNFLGGPRHRRWVTFPSRPGSASP
jgi:TPP-dependent pyruvate/acetoin dehydrogenase alpha subunit